MIEIYWQGYKTIVIKEGFRILRIWKQTLFTPLITMSLYFLIFGKLIGSRIGSIDQIQYIQYIAPGLIMMSVINNSFSAISSTIFSLKFTRSIEELLIAPLPNYILLLGFVSAGMLRGIIVGVLVSMIALFFTHLTIHHAILTILTMAMTSALFSLGGITSGIFSDSFDEIALIPTFILTPMTYLGGVFYSIHMLPPFWRDLSQLNPILYIVNLFRYSLLGISDIPVWPAFFAICGFLSLLFFFNWWLLEKGIRIKP